MIKRTSWCSRYSFSGENPSSLIRNLLFLYLLSFPSFFTSKLTGLQVNCSTITSLEYEVERLEGKPTSSDIFSYGFVDCVKRNEINPILKPNPNAVFQCPVSKKDLNWEAKDVFNPTAIVNDDQVFLLYRAEDHIGSLAGTSRIGIAVSQDGLHFNDGRGKLTGNKPVLYPDNDFMYRYEWDGGIEDPRIVEVDIHPNAKLSKKAEGEASSNDFQYVMTYTSYNGVARLCIATSNDLLLWKKHGPAFQNAFEGKFIDAWTKSGSIVSEQDPNDPSRMIASKINGLYYMFWGEYHIHLATSIDLIHWTPILDGEEEEKEKEENIFHGRPDHLHDDKFCGFPIFKVFGPRVGKFDSELVEPGPQAILNRQNNLIVFVYNSKNKYCMYNSRMLRQLAAKHNIATPSDGYCFDGENDTNLPPGTYSAGQVVLNGTNPRQVLSRSENPFLYPSEDFERKGQVNNVIFVEGLVHFKKKWLFYYGTADSDIAVAECSLSNYDKQNEQNNDHTFVHSEL